MSVSRITAKQQQRVYDAQSVREVLRHIAYAIHAADYSAAAPLLNAKMRLEALQLLLKEQLRKME